MVYFVSNVSYGDDIVEAALETLIDIPRSSNITRSHNAIASGTYEYSAKILER